MLWVCKVNPTSPHIRDLLRDLSAVEPGNTGCEVGINPGRVRWYITRRVCSHFENEPSHRSQTERHHNVISAWLCFSLKKITEWFTGWSRGRSHVGESPCVMRNKTWSFGRRSHGRQIVSSCVPFFIFPKQTRGPSTIYHLLSHRTGILNHKLLRFQNHSKIKLHQSLVFQEGYIPNFPRKVKFHDARTPPWNAFFF